MATVQSLISQATEFSVQDRIEIAMQLLDLVRESVGGSKSKSKKSKSKKSKKSADSDSSSDSDTEKKTREPSKWTIGLAAVRPILDKHNINKKLSMKLGSMLKDFPSWPAPSEKEVMNAVKEFEESNEDDSIKIHMTSSA